MLLHGGMTAKSIRERYPGPWLVEEDMTGFRVLAQDRTLICTIFAYQSLERTLKRPEARAIAHAIAKLPLIEK
jgi:hypothetical protein